MKIEFNSLIDLEEKEIGFIFLPTIILDKNMHNCDIYIGWLCFELTIEL